MIKRNEFILVLALLAIFYGLAIFPSIRGPFSFEDDHVYVKCANTDMGYFHKYENKSDYNNLLRLNLIHIRDGRFYPLTLTAIWTIARLTHADPLIAHLFVYLLGLGSGLFFFLFLRKLELSFLTSLVFSALLLGGDYDEMWYRRNGETLGVFFLVAALYFLLRSVKEDKKKFTWIGFSALFFSALSKESFTVLIPVVALLHIYMYAWKREVPMLHAVRQLGNEILVYCLLLAICLAGICYALFVEKEMFASSSSFFNREILAINVRLLAGNFVYWIPVILFFPFLPLMNGKVKKNIPLLLLAWVLWLSSQLLVYKDTEIIPFCRYLMPGLLFLLIVSAVSADRLLSVGKKYIYVACIVILIGQVGVHWKNLFLNSYFHAHRATAYQQMMDHVCAGNPEEVAILIGKGECYEFISSTTVQLSVRGLNVPIHFVEIADSGRAREFDIPQIIQNGDMIDKTPYVSADSLLNSIRDNTKIRSLMFATPAGSGRLQPDNYMKGFSNRREFSESYYTSSFHTLFSEDWKKTFLPEKTVTYVCLSR